MKLYILLCVFALLSVTLAQSLSCSAYNDGLRKYISELERTSDENIAAACDKDSKEAILKYMIKMIQLLTMRLKKPCVFTFQPLPFNSNCAPLNTANPNFFQFLVLSNPILNDICANGCEITPVANEMIADLLVKLKGILG
ncbi:hypothetical protein L596_008918 [Steinernema carpocapsae]|uniref:Saposin B-type domain-containing protein n=1 Tax=Steinernema carpocapsae TaxID=34508 RepID=A0A4U5PDV1_STECR|nr:hypothetical protein L596_008918 [Steinernema carpocapsae]